MMKKMESIFWITTQTKRKPQSLVIHKHENRTFSFPSKLEYHETFNTYHWDMREFPELLEKIPHIPKKKLSFLLLFMDNPNYLQFFN